MAPSLRRGLATSSQAARPSPTAPDPRGAHRGAHRNRRACEPRSPQTSATICIQTALRLPPSEAKSRRAGRPDVGEHFEVMAKAAGDRFQRGAPDVAAAVPEAQPGERSPRERIMDRRLFAEEIGQHPHALGAGRNGRRLRVELARSRSAADQRGEPAQHRARGRHAAVRRIETRARDDSRGTAGGRAPARSAIAMMSPAPPNLSSTSPASVSPAASAEAMWSAAPPNTGAPSGNPVAAAASADHGADSLMRCDERRKGRARQAALGDEIVGELVVGEIDEARLQRPVALDRQPSGQPVVYVVVGADDMGDASENAAARGARSSEVSARRVAA